MKVRNKLRKIFYASTAFLAAVIVILDAWRWWNDEPATWRVWLFAILFSVGIAVHAIHDLEEISLSDRVKGIDG